jgi:hypothetical protein
MRKIMNTIQNKSSLKKSSLIYETPMYKPHQLEHSVDLPDFQSFKEQSQSQQVRQKPLILPTIIVDPATSSFTGLVEPAASRKSLNSFLVNPENAVSFSWENITVSVPDDTGSKSTDSKSKPLKTILKGGEHGWTF